MPELPEVEAANSLVSKYAIGKIITAIVSTEQGGGPRDGLFDEIICDGSSSSCFQEVFVGRKLMCSKRVGKYMYWELSGSGRSPVFHFGMTGNFILHENGAKTSESTTYRQVSNDYTNWPPRFCKIEIIFEGDLRLAFTDPRRLGRIKLQDFPLKEAPICGKFMFHHK
jgi:formamidopyrimidine-DNA glycosylase